MAAAKLDAALAWAARGFRVFPVRENTRGGSGNFPVPDWVSTASGDPATIEHWWTDPVTRAPLEHNIGCLTTGLVVFDVDVKAGKPGLHEFLVDRALDFDSLTVRTPSGGFHVYHRGLDWPVGQSPLGRGLDVRGHNGYVLAPGSTIDGKPYAIDVDMPLAPVPPHIVPALHAPHERWKPNGGELPVDLDTDAALVLAGDYLDHAEPAIQGVHGDDRTYQVACRLRDLGVSQFEAFQLMLERWNERCSPPWTPDELSAKVGNAYVYATGTPGVAHPAVIFSEVTIPLPPPPLPAPTLNLLPEMFRTGRLVPMVQLEPRPWVFSRLLMRRVVTALIAAGAAGKSTLILTLAAHLAVGRDFLNFRCRVPPSKSIIYNAEDDLDEMSRRLTAICAAYQFNLEEVNKKIILLSSDDIVFSLTEGYPPTLKSDHVEKFIDAASDPEVALGSLDPLLDVHTARESDNAQMKFVMTIARMIARKANISLLIGHHTRKPSQKGVAYVGDPDASLGAVTVTNAARVALTLAPADQTDAERYGIQEDERTSYVRLDDAKMNMALQSGAPTWLKRESVKLFNGDDVGTLMPTNMQEHIEAAAAMMARVFWIEMTQKSMATLSLPAAVQLLQLTDPIHAHLPPATIKARIERFLAKGVDVEDGGHVVIARKTEKGRQVSFVVLE